MNSDKDTDSKRTSIITGPYLVTGAAGFIGSSFLSSCHRKSLRGGSPVVSPIISPIISVDKRDHFHSRPEHRGIHYGTIVDRDELPDWLRGQKPMGAIIHLGACANTLETDTAYFDQMNVKYSQFLWEYATQHRIPLIYASSAATYGDGSLGYDDNQDQMPFLRPLNPYGQSKLTFDLWALEQEKKGKAPPHWAGFKFFNVYGPGERHKGRMASVVLHAYDQIQKEGRIRLFKSHREGIADGHQKRDFIHVDDVTEALHFALGRPISRGIYNLGTGKARTFLDLARAVFRALNKPEQIHFIDTPMEIRDRYQYFTEAKMERLRAQGYSREFLTLEEGVERYIRRLLASQD